MTHLYALLEVVQEVCTPIQQDRRDIEQLKIMQQDVVVNPVTGFRKVNET